MKKPLSVVAPGHSNCETAVAAFTGCHPSRSFQRPGVCCRARKYPYPPISPTAPLSEFGIGSQAASRGGVGYFLFLPNPEAPIGGWGYFFSLKCEAPPFSGGGGLIMAAFRGGSVMAVTGVCSTRGFFIFPGFGPTVTWRKGYSILSSIPGVNQASICSLARASWERDEPDCSPASDAQASEAVES